MKMKYTLLAIAVFCLTVVAAAHIAAKVNPSLVSNDVLEQLNSLFVVGLACMIGYMLHDAEHMLEVNNESGDKFYD